MSADFKSKAIKVLKEAVEEDKSGNYEKAIENYKNGLNYLTMYACYHKNEQTRQAIISKYREYLERVKYLKTMLKAGHVNQKNPTVAKSSNQEAAPGGKDGQKYDKNEENEESKLQKWLLNIMLSEKPNVKWGDVAGLENAKEALKEAVLMPVKFPQFFTGKRKQWCGILLYGPPGIGKTYLAKALATEANCTFLHIPAVELCLNWKEETKEAISNLFEMARKNSPAIVFLDDLDILFSDVCHSETLREIKTQLFVEIQAVKDAGDSLIFVLTATSHPYKIEGSVRKRFDRRIYLPVPEAPARTLLLKSQLKSTPNDLTACDFGSLSKITEGFSADDVLMVVRQAVIQSLKDLTEATHFREIPGENGPKYTPCAPDELNAKAMTLEYLLENNLEHRLIQRPVTMSDFSKVMSVARPSITKEELELFDRFTEEFGE